MSGEWLVPLLTLTAMEIVLGIDNVIFIAILAGKLPAHQQASARRLGLGLALAMRLGLLFTLSKIMELEDPIFSLASLGVPESWVGHEGAEISWRDIILLAGGLFLIGKSTFEIHDKLEGPHEKSLTKGKAQFGLVLFQILILDIVFSLDSVITAVGMARQIWVMVVAMVIAVGVMLIFAGKISDFVHRHPTLKILALSFLILIGVMLVAEGLGQHIGKGYIYFAMAFSLVIETLNMRVRAITSPVELHDPHPASNTVPPTGQ